MVFFYPWCCALGIGDVLGMKRIAFLDLMFRLWFKIMQLSLDDNLESALFKLCLLLVTLMILNVLFLSCCSEEADYVV